MSSEEKKNMDYFRRIRQSLPSKNVTVTISKAATKRTFTDDGLPQCSSNQQQQNLTFIPVDRNGVSQHMLYPHVTGDSAVAVNVQRPLQRASKSKTFDDAFRQFQPVKDAQQGFHSRTMSPSPTPSTQSTDSASSDECYQGPTSGPSGDSIYFDSAAAGSPPTGMHVTVYPQSKYKTTVYNINSINLSEDGTNPSLKKDTTGGKQSPLLNPTTAAAGQLKPNDLARVLAETNNYQQTYPNMYANHLCQQTKDAVKKKTLCGNKVRLDAPLAKMRKVSASGVSPIPVPANVHPTVTPDRPLSATLLNGPNVLANVAPKIINGKGLTLLIPSGVKNITALAQASSLQYTSQTLPGSSAKKIPEPNAPSLAEVLLAEKQIKANKQRILQAGVYRAIESPKPSCSIADSIRTSKGTITANLKGYPGVKVTVIKPNSNHFAAPVQVYGAPRVLPLPTASPVMLNKKPLIIRTAPGMMQPPGYKFPEPPPAHGRHCEGPYRTNVTLVAAPSIQQTTYATPPPCNATNGAQGILNLDTKGYTQPANASTMLSRNYDANVRKVVSPSNPVKFRRIEYETEADGSIRFRNPELLISTIPAINNTTTIPTTTIPTTTIPTTTIPTTTTTTAIVNEPPVETLASAVTHPPEEMVPLEASGASVSGEEARPNFNGLSLVTVAEMHRYGSVTSRAYAAVLHTELAIQRLASRKIVTILENRMETFTCASEMVRSVMYDPLPCRPTARTRIRRRYKPKPIRSLVPYLQDGPCYEVASRLPKCRECGRSAAVRTRHAESVFCRFISFRKLKYNAYGQKEVVGFADPNTDPKDSDTGLWSSNLAMVPSDLTIEKSKFLLGQVGYKFCELFHQEKEAYFEHISEDKTVAWKQAVHGVREMCDVCQTTLFNYHWVCSTCGFVVCIDCYKGRKHGLFKKESTSKDTDAEGWLLCTSKDPHAQEKLMLTQIIPSNCLYKLVRQMHGVCALLEIPLNCECPLSKEPLFRKIKDKLEFIYPITVTPREVPPGDASPSPRTRMVSITIKNIEETVNEKRDNAIGCRISFAKEFSDTRDPAGVLLNRKEKQSYCFDGFQEEIIGEGEIFDETLYKVIKKEVKEEDLDPLSLQGGESDSNSSVHETKVNLKLDSPVGTGNGWNDSNNHKTLPEFVLREIAKCPDIVNIKREPESDDVPKEIGTDTNGLIVPEIRLPNGVTESIQIKTEKNEFGEPMEKPSDESFGNSYRAKLEKIETDQLGNVNNGSASEQQPPEYSEEGRLKPSPTLDSRSFNMIVKQLLKFDKSINIFERFAQHMSATEHQLCSEDDGRLPDFVESVQIQHKNVQEFLRDFLNDFVFLKGNNSSDDLTNERQIFEYNKYMKGSVEFQNKGERRMDLSSSQHLYPKVNHQWLCNGRLLRLLDPLNESNYATFHDQWERGQPVMVSDVSSKLNMDLWLPESFGRDFGEQTNDLINCLNGKLLRGQQMKVFWDGFEMIGERLIDERDRPMLLKLKDWPPGDDFAEMMPSRFYDLMRSLPLAEYTRREGRLNLASRLCSFFVRPDLGPKMYSAYGSALHPNRGTTNLHLDISDAVNVMVYVGVPKDQNPEKYAGKILEVVEDCDPDTRKRIEDGRELPGALWHIFHARDADKIRLLLNKVETERGVTIKPNHDPIHDQKWYLDSNLRRRLLQEYQVEGYAILQCAGDAIFIPAGAPHQVRNLHNCIKVAEDFVSPENISYCFKLTNEFRHLTKTHSNHEDKLQIKNIIYHTVKDAVSSITNPLIMAQKKIDLA